MPDPRGVGERLTEEAVFESVAREIQRGQISEGLWAKALAEAGGDRDLARSLYIGYRAQSIVDQAAIDEAAARAEEAAAAKGAREAAAAARTKEAAAAATAGNTPPKEVFEAPKIQAIPSPIADLAACRKCGEWTAQPSGICVLCR